MCSSWNTATNPDGTVSSADGVPIRYHVEGDGDPALVFVHCWTCDRHFWDGQVSRFAERHRVVTLDLPGHGQSGRERERWTMGAFGNDVRAVVEALGLKQVVLIGHSMGGPVVLEAARRMSNDRLTAVIPVDSLHDADALHVPETVEEALGDFRRDFAAATSKLVRERLFIPSSDPALVERVARHASSMSPDIGFSALREAWVYDARPALREIGAPIRAINTDLFPTNVDANRRYAPQYDVVIMRGVGHYPMLEDPEGFNRALEGVLHDVIAQESR